MRGQISREAENRDDYLAPMVGTWVLTVHDEIDSWLLLWDLRVIGNI